MNKHVLLGAGDAKLQCCRLRLIPGRSDHWVPHGQDDHSWPWSRRYDPVAADLGAQHLDLRQFTNECLARCRTLAAVSGLSHAYFRGLTAGGLVGVERRFSGVHEGIGSRDLGANLYRGAGYG